MMYWDGNGMSGWGYALMTVSTVLFWTLIVGGVFALVRYLGRTGQPTGTMPEQPVRHTPEQLLAERFARGEIDADEYRARLDILQAGGHHPLARS